MKKKIFIAGFAIFALTACGGEEESTENNENSEATDSTTTEEVEVSGAIDPFPEFPKGATTAGEGDIILTPSKNWQEDATSGDAADQTFIFYNATMATPGEGYSTVDFLFDGEVEIPNYMIIPIKPSQTAKKGDILLTWWQSGSGMKRAIVVDDANPAEPIVNYIDMDWDNPATNSEGVGFGQVKEQIKPGTFHVLTSQWEAGTTVAVSTDGKYKAATVVSVIGDKVLTVGFAGKMAVYSKSDCSPVVVQPSVKAGDMVQAPWVGSFVNTKVIKVDALMGRVWCEDPYSDDPMVIPFGDVTSGLTID
jgi:hypothetical protein